MTRESGEFPSSDSGSSKALALQKEVNKMLLKNALEIISDRHPSFCKILFLVEKAFGLETGIDFSPLGHTFCKVIFALETGASVLPSSAKDT